MRTVRVQIDIVAGAVAWAGVTSPFFEHDDGLTRFHQGKGDGEAREPGADDASVDPFVRYSMNYRQ